MRILKYLFLLFLLSLVALSIFIATQKGDFQVERSKIINSPKAVVFSYVNDYKNWSEFGSWATEDPEIKMIFPENTIGKGAAYSWESKDGDGDMKTLFAKENDSISQKMNYNGTLSSVYWTFKDAKGGTKVTWNIKGKMSFAFKVYTALNGGVDRVIGSMFEKSLENLDKSLVYEINTFNVKVDGLVQKPMTYYLGQTFTTEISKINKNFKIVVPKIKSFCQQNDINTVGRPFIVYHTYDEQTQLARITIAVPIEREIFISSGSDIISSKLAPFEAVKATLTGDNSHNKAAYDKALAYFNQNKLTHDPTITHIEIYNTNKTEVKDPSKWITEVYIPMPPKVVVPVKTYTPAPVETETDYTRDAETNTNPTTPKTTVVKPTTPKVGTPKAVTPKAPKPEAEKVVKPEVPKKTVIEKPVTEEDEFEF
ncbi:SRPBCC family protein [Flavobacterium sp. PL002]|uniref:SRPBCC family protein n=1 Tax=Flavobacterium sp. PL002 TaxID=1897058 RepID=UPI0017886003|nr:SRPBCC family protein [Flavobacterium sp. PL002]MBE0391190.1 hypothetical protein [Flavobacterium sp. PL002]